MIPWLLLSCTGTDPEAPPSAPPARPEARATGAFAFAHHTDQGTFTLPDSVRPGDEPAPVEFAPHTRFTPHETRNRTRVWRVPLPVHDNLLPTRMRGTHTFGSEPPPGFEVLDAEGRPMAFERRGRKSHTYGFDRDWLYVGKPRKGSSPEGIRVRFPKATATENALNFATAGLEPAAFVGRSLTIGQTSYTGLFLPAPAQAVWTVEVPERARLSFEGTVLEPAIAHPVTSDGATVRVFVRDEGAEHAVGQLSVSPLGPTSARLDLSAFAGRTVEIVFRSDPGPTPTFDYVFLEDPTLYTPSDDPQRVVLLFVDTLRHDHLGTYGYERDTTPALDGWAGSAVVFENARSVAPWTLPSARAALSGRQPEQWYAGPSLPRQLSEAGWHTDAVVSNAFLSQPFDMQRGWDRFHYDHLMPADELVAHAQRALSRHPDRDALVLVHFMEPHLPYMEGFWHRGLFAGDRPEALESLTRRWLVDLERDDPHFAEIRDHVVDRYDQNIRAVDDAVASLLRTVGPDATTVLFSDHGEEFWDHGDFEHGHSFYDELLRVPLVVRSPGLPPGRVDTPVSLLDITPTVLELAGLSADPEVPGASLVPLAWGDDGAAARVSERPQGFGRPLYGPDGWGVLADGRKWWDRAGEQHLYAVEADPAESLDLAPTAPDPARWPAALTEALDREVVRTWRLDLESLTWPFEVTLTATHPEGFEGVWKAYDPRGRAASAAPEVVDGDVVMTLGIHEPAPPALFLQPAGDPDALDELTVRIEGRQLEVEGSTSGDDGKGNWSFTVVPSWAPVPDDGVEVSGFHPDVQQQLRELGYLDEE